MGQRVTKNMISKTFFGRFLLNISVNMKDTEKFVINFFVENIILRVLKKDSSKSVQEFKSYVQKSGQMGCPSTFLG